MNLFEEIKEFFKSFLLWVYFFLGFTLFFLSFNLKEIAFLGSRIFLPLPSFYSFSVQIFNYLEESLLPAEVNIVVLDPLNAFLAEVMLSFLLAFVITFPLFIYQFIRFISPGLYGKEKKRILQTVLFSGILFILGCSFAYFFLVPSSFNILYSFASVLGASLFFTAYDFVSLTFILVLSVGIMFQIPILMVLLSRFGLISSSFWKEKYKYIFLGFLLFSAIITPDGTGVTMLLLFLPLAGLYFLGYRLAIRGENKKSNLGK